MAISSCPRCNNNSAEFIKIETGMKLGLQEAEQLDSSYDSVCPPCYQELGQFVSQGARLRAERKAKEANRINMWQNRVNMIKKARSLMTHKSFAEAATSYEKYLRVVEIIYDRQSGELTPDLFKNSSRSKELTIITSVYWDLMRIYDTNPRYNSRQRKVAEKLAEFARYTPIFRNISQKAKTFTKSAKNKDNFKHFLTAAGEKPGPCFIATAAFNNYNHPEVKKLCSFRDDILINYSTGRLFIKLYYKISPPIAEIINKSLLLKKVTRIFLRLVTALL